MKKLILLIFIIILSTGTKAFCENYTTSNMKVFSTENQKYFGLKNSDDEIIVEPEYKKLIRLGDNSWIVQKKKFGLIDCKGNILVKPKYSHVERLFDKWVKLGNNKDFGLYDQYGTTIIPPKFKSIEPLFGYRFLTYKNYKYGIYNDKGEEVLANKYDFIYMPTPKTMRIKYEGDWYELEQINKDDAITIPDAIVKEVDGETIKITKLFKNTGLGAGYGVVTATDYTLKIFSTISEAYEQTIDELMLSKGVETVSIFIKLGWLPKFPFVYAKKYYENIFTPDNSPLSGIRNDLKEQME